MPTRGSHGRRYWSQNEDDRLRHGVRTWSDKRGKDGHWDKIGKLVGTRTAKECRARWFQCLHPNLRHGRWTQEEDDQLRSAYKVLGPAWAEIARRIPGRTDDQCSKRFNDVLNPKAQRRLRPWSSSEDKLLLERFHRYGPKWQQISQGMVDRTGLTCRNRWRKLNVEKPNMTSSLEAKHFPEGQDILYDLPEHNASNLPDFTQLEFLNSLEQHGPRPGNHSYTVALEPHDHGLHGAMEIAIREHDMAHLLELASANNQNVVINHYFNVENVDYSLGLDDLDLNVELEPTI